MNGNGPSRSITSTATTTSLPLNNASNSQQPPQLLHLQQQHGILQQKPAMATRYKEQIRVLPGHTQISFGGNYISSMPPQGQQLLNNNQPFDTTVLGTPPNGGNLKANSQGNKVGSSMSTSSMQETENSSARTSQKSSLVCGRNVPSILSSSPGHLSKLKY
ncbi:hypothetical protein SESBI_43220 [Sesbania bispinosa]|nr:hypothetical protein SESBI_43220 [Sesbania bispinosa]